ncbi:MAG: acyl-CoA dehydrogenase [Desulfobulbaceae bacterium]|nr:MAG: acyl-CoA dehydrogenase [Desulfobulbaceae bacterium]
MAKKVFNSGEFLIKSIDCDTIFTPEDFTDEHKQIAATSMQFIENEIWPINDQIEAKNFDLVRSNLRKCGELGLMMIDAPEDIGGLELDKVTSMVVSETFAFGKSFGLTYMCHTGIGMLPLLYYGTRQQKEKYLDNLMSGAWVGAYCLTEPGSGSDALGAKSTAHLSEDGSHYILNGTKQFITNSGFSDLYTVFAQVDNKHFTGFLVERSFKGLEIGPEEKKMGNHGTSTCQVIMNNVKVPVENLLGEVGKGHKIAFNVLNIGRFKLGATCTGQIKYALAEGSRYANERKQFNTVIAKFGAIREKLADVTAMAFAGEAVVYRLAGMIDDRHAIISKDTDDYSAEYQRGIEEYAAECAIIKVLCTEYGAQSIDTMLQIHGGYGYIAEYPIEQLYRDERVQRIWEGTNEVNRLLIPGTYLRKGLNNNLLSLDLEADSKSDFIAEKKLLTGMKTIYSELVDNGLKTFGKKITAEQEVLLTLADMIIQIFALESVILRVDKALKTTSDTKAIQYQAVARVCTFKMRQQFIAAAEQCAAFMDQDVSELLTAHTTYSSPGLLQAKQQLAEATSLTEKYIF